MLFPEFPAPNSTLASPHDMLDNVQCLTVVDSDSHALPNDFHTVRCIVALAPHVLVVDVSPLSSPSPS